MPDLNDPLKESYIAAVGSAIGAYTDELKAQGFDPTSRIEQLTGAGKIIEGAKKARVAADKAATAAIANEQAVREQFYKLATDSVSLVEGLLSKNHDATAKLRGLRAELIGNQNPSGTAPAPAPAAPAK